MIFPKAPLTRLSAPGLCLLLAVTLITAVQYWSEFSPNVGKYKPTTYPPDKIELFVFGYHESVADSLWLRLIQDLDFCGKERISTDKFENLVGLDFKPLDPKVMVTLEQKKAIEHEASEVIKNVVNRPRKDVCDRGWAFKYLDAITDLAPRFRMPYAVGAGALTVLTEDHLGAKIIYDKALKNFPNDWPILYRAAYLYLFEFQDMEKAAELLYRAGQNGAPDWVQSLAARLYTQAGRALLGVSILEEYKKTLASEEHKKQVQERIDRLKAEFAQEH